MTDKFDIVTRQLERIVIPNQRFFTDDVGSLDWLLSLDRAE